jgi:hypothetical protein
MGSAIEFVRKSSGWQCPLYTNLIDQNDKSVMMEDQEFQVSGTVVLLSPSRLGNSTLASQIDWMAADSGLSLESVHISPEVP